MMVGVNNHFTSEMITIDSWNAQGVVADVDAVLDHEIGAHRRARTRMSYLFGRRVGVASELRRYRKCP